MHILPDCKLGTIFNHLPLISTFESIGFQFWISSLLDFFLPLLHFNKKSPIVFGFPLLEGDPWSEMFSFILF